MENFNLFKKQIFYMKKYFLILLLLLSSGCADVYDSTNFGSLTNFPATCPPGFAIQDINRTTFTCVAIDVNVGDVNSAVTGIIGGLNIDVNSSIGDVLVSMNTFIPTEGNIDGNALGVVNDLDFNNSLSYSSYNCDNNSDCTITGTVNGYVRDAVFNAAFPVADGNLTKTGDWTGTFDGEEGTYYLDYTNFTNTPSIPSDSNVWTEGFDFDQSVATTSSPNFVGLSIGTDDLVAGEIVAYGADASSGGALYLYNAGDSDSVIPYYLVDSLDGEMRITDDAMGFEHKFFDDGTWLLDGNGTIDGNVIVDCVQLQDGNIFCSYANLEENLNIELEDISLKTIDGATYNDLNHFVNFFGSTGRATGGAISDAGSETVDVAGGTGFIKKIDADNVTLYAFDWSAASGLSVPTNTVRYIGVDYNSGSPGIVVETDNSWDYDTEFPLGSVINQSGDLYVLNNPWWVTDGITNLIERFQAEGYVVRDDYVGGLALGVSGLRNPTLTAGTIWSRLNEFDISAIDTNGVDTFYGFYRDGGGGWSRTPALSNYDVNVYDDGSGTLTALNNNWYASYWVFLEVNNSLMLIYPQNQYANIAGAEEESIPTFPVSWYEHGLLVGRIVFQEGEDDPVSVESVFDTMFSGSAVNTHNDLSGLQGGSADEYYHLSSSQFGEYEGLMDESQFDGNFNRRAWDSDFNANYDLRFGEQFDVHAWDSDFNSNFVNRFDALSFSDSDFNSNLDYAVQNGSYSIVNSWDFEDGLTTGGGFGSGGCSLTTSGILYCQSGVFAVDLNAATIQSTDLNGDFNPSLDNEWKLGDATIPKRWKEVNAFDGNFADDVLIQDDLTVSGKADITENVTANGVFINRRSSPGMWYFDTDASDPNDYAQWRFTQYSTNAYLEARFWDDSASAQTIPFIIDFVNDAVRIVGDELRDSGNATWITSDGSQNTTLAGDLTVSGTGTSSFAGDLEIGSGITLDGGDQKIEINSNTVTHGTDGLFDLNLVGNSVGAEIVGLSSNIENTDSTAGSYATAIKGSASDKIAPIGVYGIGLLRDGTGASIGVWGESSSAVNGTGEMIGVKGQINNAINATLHKGVEGSIGANVDSGTSYGGYFENNASAGTGYALGFDGEIQGTDNTDMGIDIISGDGSNTCKTICDTSNVGACMYGYNLVGPTYDFYDCDATTANGDQCFCI